MRFQFPTLHGAGQGGIERLPFGSKIRDARRGAEYVKAISPVVLELVLRPAALPIRAIQMEKPSNPATP